MYDVCSLGDALIDFKPVKSLEGEDCIQPNAGGTAANLACACARMGLRCAMLGKVGSDQFGQFLLRTFEQYGVDTSGVIVDEDVRTTLAFVSFDENRDRSFSFFRNPGADMMLREDEVDLDILGASRVFYFSSMALTDEPERSACRSALEFARAHGCQICFDVNFRHKLWKDMDEAREVIRAYLCRVDILKLSEEELAFICGQDGPADMEQAADGLFRRCGPKLLVVSLGERGCFYRTAAWSGMLPGYPVRATDTTGAGDAFVGGMLSSLCRRFDGAVEQCSQAELEQLLDFANAAGAVSVTRLGSITSLPDEREVASFLAGRAGKSHV